MFLLGHSHVVALEQGAKALQLPYRSLNLWGFGRPVLYDTPGAPTRLEPELAGMLGDTEFRRDRGRFVTEQNKAKYLQLAVA